MVNLQYIDNINYKRYNEFVNAMDEITDLLNSYGKYPTRYATEIDFDVEPYEVLSKFNDCENFLNDIRGNLKSLIMAKTSNNLNLDIFDIYYNSSIEWKAKQSSKKMLVDRWVDCLTLYYNIIANDVSPIILSNGKVLRCDEVKEVVSENKVYGSVSTKTENLPLYCTNKII